MNKFAAAVDAWAATSPDAVAFCNSAGERITYGQLKHRSDTLACALANMPEQTVGRPVVVYGHKSPYMLVCFLACIKAGCAYVPTDVSFPAARIGAICKQLSGAIVLDTSSKGIGPVADALRIVPLQEIERLSQTSSTTDASYPPQDMSCLEGDDTLYILFTSGSTGTPKGVEVSASCLDNFCSFMTEQFASTDKQVFFNRVPFSFDVSLTDMALGLTRGDTLFALVEDDEQNMAALFKALAASNATWWISTPSAIEMCLADPSFSHDVMPCLHTVFLAGEVLKPQTVRDIYARFPHARVMNAYGPTESTDIVTWCWIDQSMLDEDAPLPIGFAKSGTRLLVLDPETLAPVPCGKRGELFIVGDTVAKGYYGRPDLTQASFGCCPPNLAQGERSYRTGDEVLMTEDGLVYYFGRLDQQVKVHGYRIELGEIESTLSTQPQVAAACVVPVLRNGAIAHLAAFVVPASGVQPSFELTKVLKAQLKEVLPSYMVPRSFKYQDTLPQNVNGKIDRKALAELTGSN